jgi:single-strand DNA-binding protein
LISFLFSGFSFQNNFLSNTKSNIMEIIGRTTADAQRKTLTDGRELVNFSIAINDNYKPKGAMEIKKVVTYVDCSYWLSTGIAQYLKKGALVQLSGNMAARAWINLQGEPKAGLNFHVNTIKLHGGSTKANTANELSPVSGKPTEDLPF